MNRIKELRMARGLSQVQLGQLINRDQTLVSKLENGLIDFDMSMADALSKALSAPIEHLRSKNNKDSVNHYLQPQIANVIGNTTIGSETVPILVLLTVRVRQ